MIKKIDEIISIIIYSTLPTMIIILAVSITTFTKNDIQIKKEHAVMLKSLEGYGGISGSKSVKQIEEEIDAIHGINNYHWKYKEIEKPFYSDDVKIRFEKGWRWFNSKQCRNLNIDDVSNDGEWDNHKGVDYIVDHDLRIKAGISGKVYSGYGKKAGYYINILKEEFWNDKKLIRYNIKPTGKGKLVQTILKHFHLSYIDVEDGQQIEKGQYIGNIGDSGRAVGLHLHQELWIDGRNVNPFSNSTYNKRVMK